MTLLSALLGGGTSAVPWVSGMTVQKYAYVISPADNEVYQRITAAGGGATDPADDYTNYLARTFVRVDGLPQQGLFNPEPTINNIAVWGVNAVKTTPTASGAGVRKVVLSLTGRGVLQTAQIVTSVNLGSTRFEVIRDGKTVLDFTANFNIVGSYICQPLVGSASAGGAMNGPNPYTPPAMTFLANPTLPFKRNLTIAITPTNALNGTSVTFGYLMSSGD